MRIFENLTLKLASLALAALLWFVIVGEKSSERGLAVPVELQNFPKGLELTNEAVNQVEVRLRAAPSIMQQLVLGEVSARIDLDGLGEGEHILHLGEDAIRVPFGVKVVKITPSILTLQLERTLSKSVPIRPRIVGRPAQGYEVFEIKSEPAEAVVQGPSGRVRKVQGAFTEPVSVEGARQTVSAQVNLGLEDPLLRLEQRPSVTVQARIRERREQRSLTRPVQVRDGAGNPRPASVEVVLSGPASIVAQLSPEQISAYVSLRGLREGRGLVAVELGAGLTGVSVVSVAPTEVLLRPTGAKRD